MNISETAVFHDFDLDDDGEFDIDLDYFHVKDCSAKLYHPGGLDSLHMVFDSLGAQAYMYGTPDSISPVFNYGAYVPEESYSPEFLENFFTFGSEYQIECFCPEFEDLGIIYAVENVYANDQPVFLDGEDI